MRENYTQLAKIINIFSLWLRQHFFKGKARLARSVGFDRYGCLPCWEGLMTDAVELNYRNQRFCVFGAGSMHRLKVTISLKPQ